MKVDHVLNCDVVTVGIGAAGMTAAAKAAKDGAKVIGIDRASGFEATNNVSSTAVMAVESSEQKQDKDYMTVKEAFRYIWKINNFQANSRFLMHALKAGGPAIDLLKEGGVEFIPTYHNSKPGDDITTRAGHIYKVSGKERAKQFQKLLDDKNITQLWNTCVTKLLFEDGEVKGVFAKANDGTTYQINAKGGVVVAGGGFLQNPDMVLKYFGIPKVYGYANSFCDGSGIKLDQSVGAQTGKNFTIAMNEGGGVNHKSKNFMKTLWGDNNLFRLALLGGVIVNKYGRRFVDEAELTMWTMYNSEPLIREGGTFYTIVDQHTLDILKTMTLDEYTQKYLENKVTAPMFVMAFANIQMKDIDKDVALAKEEGWCWEADTLEELAQKTGLTNLASEVKNYNQMCKKGEDTELFKNSDFLNEMPEGPYYAIENDFSGWVTQGGIKTDGDCCAVDKNNDVIKGLFVAGADGDFWAVPYLVGGSAQGFSLASGYIAGEAAYKRALNKKKFDKEHSSNVGRVEVKETSSTNWQDGIYEETAKGRNGDFNIKVEIAEGRIKSVKVTGDNETSGIGSRALDVLPKKIVEKQTAYVDAVSGATVSSNAIKYAVKEILKKAEN